MLKGTQNDRMSFSSPEKLIRRGHEPFITRLVVLEERLSRRGGKKDVSVQRLPESKWLAREPKDYASSVTRSVQVAYAKQVTLSVTSIQ